MRASFTFPFGATFTDEQIAAFGRIGVTITLDDEGKPRSWETHTADLRAVLAIAPESNPTITMDMPAVPLLHVLDKLDAIEARQRLAQPESYVNTKVDVHVPGLGLLAIDKVEAVEDCCTEEVASRIADGWRIVAVCPQPDQRRPDYVFGRTMA